MTPNKEALQNYDLGRRLLAGRQIHAAAEAFENSLRLQPDLIASAVGLGLCRIEMRDGHGMFEAFKLALELIGRDTPQAQVWLTLSKLYFELGYTADAVEAQRRILSTGRAA